EAEIIISMVQGELLPHAVLALTECADSSSHGCHMLTDGEVEPLHKGRVDVPTQGSQHGIDGLQRAKHHAVPHPHQAPAVYGLDDLRVQQLWEWQPPRLGCRALRLPARWLHPLPIVGQ